ncbi:Neurexin-4 [Nymphon striatum]|nr:Neurexin-4 [Nymphon striatum]
MLKETFMEILPTHGKDHREERLLKTKVLTVVHHDTESAVYVQGMEASGSYSRDISYNGTDISLITELIDVSEYCHQYIQWSCKGAAIDFWYPSETDSWWVGRGWKNQYYWGGAETDSRACACHPFCFPTKRNSTCNCDSNYKLQWLFDDGLLIDKSRLPVLQLRFGDTGEDNEAGQHVLGPLVCSSVTHEGE